MKKLYVYIPGLGGEWMVRRQRNIVHRWQTNSGRETLFLCSRWTDQRESYENKLQRLSRQVREAGEGYDLVCLVGTSAGGTLGLNLFYALRAHSRARFVSISGKITGVDAIGDRYRQPHPALVPSVRHSERIIPRLTRRDKVRILTVGPVVDEVVHTRFMRIPGVRHKTIPSLTHILSIWLVIRWFPGIIFRFAEQELNTI